MAFRDTPQFVLLGLGDHRFPKRREKIIEVLAPWIVEFLLLTENVGFNKTLPNIA